MGKYSRVDGKKSLNCCSTTSLVVIVAFCLVGVWMLMSSVVPIQSQNLSTEENATGKSSKQYEESSGGLFETVTRGDDNGSDSQSETSSDIEINQNVSQDETVSTSEENQDEGVSKEVSEVESSKQYKESSGGLFKTVTRGDDNGSDSQSETSSDIEINQNVSQDETVSTSEENQDEGVSKEISEVKVDSESDNDDEGNQQEKIVKESSDEKIETEEEPKTDNENDGDEKVNDPEASSGDWLSNSEAGLTEEVGGKTSETEQTELEASSGVNTSESQEGEKKLEGDETVDEKKQEDEVPSQTEEKVEKNQDGNSKESDTSNNMEIEKETQKSSVSKYQSEYGWKLCHVTAGPDYIPCLDNWKSIRKLPSTKHYEHRERHCPEEASTCLVPLPEGYKRPIQWPTSRDKIWYHNVPHTKLAVVKGHQNWVKVTGEYLTFPGGGTQFKNGALHYIDFIQKSRPDIAWGKRSRVILDVGCGVASFGGFLFNRDVLAMSFAPKDEHEAQVQFALERGIPAISAVMGTTRLPYPSSVFDLVHCARCRVPWHVEGGKLLLELNRVLRPGGYFVWSATPVYQKLPEDAGIWKAMSKLTKSMCWDLVVINKDRLNQVGAAIYRKPSTNECYNKRARNEPPVCNESDDPNAAWKVPLEACIHKVPEDASDRGSQWPPQWPLRLEKPPYWLKSQLDVDGKSAPEDFISDYKHWKNVVSKTYLNGMGINWSSVRNVLDMRAVYGGFAAALKGLKVWVMNVVPPIDSRDTLAIIFERGLIGMYHDWCESFSTYPRTYDVIHADHIFSVLKKRCNLVAVIAEVDRILRPEGKLIVWDNAETLNEIESMAKSLQWDIRFTYSKDNKGLLCIQKTFWRPTEQETILSAIA